MIVCDRVRGDNNRIRVSDRMRVRVIVCDRDNDRIRILARVTIKD